MKLSDKAYNFLKWFCLIALPGASVLYGALAGVWGWNNSTQIQTTINAVATFIGVLIGVSQYNISKEG